MSLKKVVKKDDLKRLMKETRTNTSKNKIDSPLAKYDSLGHLVCVVCNTRIKTELLWNAHIRGRTHKENVERLKANKESPGQSVSLSTSKDVQAEKPFKRPLPADFVSNSTSQKKPALAAYPSSSDEEDDDEGGDVSSREDNQTKVTSSSNDLPADFFDDPTAASHTITSSEASQSTQGEAATSAKTMSESLPEGFFDDPKKDAKARQIEYVDKMDEEWGRFEKEMKDAAVTSEAITEADDEKVEEERTLEEVDGQMMRWSHIHKLWQKKDTMTEESKTLLSGQQPVKANESEGDSEEGYYEEEEEDSWRMKRLAK